jgi:hypothetical protein
MYTQELAHERIRENIELARELHVANQLRTLERARRNAAKAERRLIEAWRIRNAVETALETR